MMNGRDPDLRHVLRVERSRRIGTRAVIVAVAFAALSACEVVDRPNRPVPDDFEVQLLDGTFVDKKAMAGKRWLINFWLPG